MCQFDDHDIHIEEQFQSPSGAKCVLIIEVRKYSVDVSIPVRGKMCPVQKERRMTKMTFQSPSGAKCVFRMYTSYTNTEEFQSPSGAKCVLKGLIDYTTDQSFNPRQGQIHPTHIITPKREKVKQKPQKSGAKAEKPHSHRSIKIYRSKANKRPEPPKRPAKQ